VTLTEARWYDAPHTAFTGYVDRYFAEKLADCQARRKAAILRASRLV
jgi:hypothetical protein